MLHLLEKSITRIIIYYTVGPPSVTNVTFITYSHEIKTSINNSKFLIGWSQSDCAVQYVVTIINSSDDRVYPDINTSNTNTTVTFPTGLEFCVTLVAVDSIGRRGPDSVPACYGEVPKFHEEYNSSYNWSI